MNKPGWKRLMRGAALAVVLLAGGTGAWAQNAVRGKTLFFATNGAPLSCGTSGCHGNYPTVVVANVQKGTTGAAILAAITANKGGMAILNGFVNATDAADIAAFIVNPAAANGMPTVALSAASVTFAAQTVGTSSAVQTVTVSNGGTAPLSISALTLGGTAAADFSRTGTCMAGGSVAAGASCTLQFTFTPSAAGARNATLTLTHNAAGGSSAITLAGTGSPAPAAATASPAALSFSQTVNTASNAQTVTVTNTGGQPLTLSAVTLGGGAAADYAIGAGATCSAGTVLNGGATCGVPITFTPAALGARSATLSIAHSAAGSPLTVALNGSGVAAPQPAISLSATAVMFAARAVGSASPIQSVTLTNTGQAPLTLNTLALAGAQATDFTRAGTCAAAATVAAGATCRIDLSVTPGAAGARAATLTVTSNAANGDAVLALSATGLQVSMTVSPMSATLATTVGAMSTTTQHTISNTGASVLTVASITLAPPFVLRPGPNACAAAPIDLSSGQSCNLFVAFQPNAEGMVTGDLMIASNASATPTRVTLSGQAMPAAGAGGNAGYGGCSIAGADARFDPVLPALLALALAVMLLRRRRR